MPTDESQKRVTVTYKFYKDGVFQDAHQVQLSHGVDPEQWIESLNADYKRLHYSGLLTTLLSLELFAEVGV